MSRPLTQRRPKLAMTLLLLLVLGGGMAVLPMALHAQAPAKKEGKEAKGEKGKGKGKEKDAEQDNAIAAAKPTTPAVPTTGLIAYGRMLPVGQAHKDMEIPSFKNGAPASMVQARVMTRTDDENMFLEKMNIWMYGPPGEAEKDLRVQLRTATYHMPSSIIASDERSRISRSDFDLQGDSLIFDTATGQGKMVGNVKMVLQDASSFAKVPGADSVEKENKETEKAPSTEGSSTEDGKTSATATATNTPGKSPTPASPSTSANATKPANASSGKPGTAGASPTNPKK